MQRKISLKCKNCGRVFETKLWSIKMGWGTFCSRQCHYADARMGKDIRCWICGKEIYRSPSKLKCSKSGKFFCSKSCQTVWRNGEFKGKKHRFWKDGASTYRDVIIKSGIPQTCSICRTKDKRVLAVHHKDGNKKNYDLDNLVWLCHNCHHRVHRGASLID